MGSTDFATLYRQADTALYQVKRHGKQRFCMYKQGMQLRTEAEQVADLTKLE